jgi:hypothetical protein
MKTDWLTKTLLMAILIAQLFILLRPHPTPTMAQEDTKHQPPAPPVSAPAPKFDHLRFFTYSNGATGVFDTTDGMLYLYDTNLLNAPIARQLVKPGEPMKRVRG